MNTKQIAIAVAGALLSVAAQAAPVTVDFNAGGISGDFTQGGVTFSSASGGAGVFSAYTPNGSLGLLEMSSPYQLIRADIAGGTNMVSVDLGDYNSDADTLVLRAYSASDVLLGSTSVYWDYSASGMTTLSLSAVGISYAIFGAEYPALNGSSVYADNFVYSAAQPVPEPETYAMMMAGLGLLAGVARRRKAAKG